MPSEFDLGLLLQGENDENWYFSVPGKQANDIKQIPVQHEETVDGKQLNVTEFSYDDSGTSVPFTRSEDAALADDDHDRASVIKLKTEDYNGNKMTSH